MYEEENEDKKFKEKIEEKQIEQPPPNQHQENQLIDNHFSPTLRPEFQDYQQQYPVQKLSNISQTG